MGNVQVCRYLSEIAYKWHILRDVDLALEILITFLDRIIDWESTGLRENQDDFVAPQNLLNTATTAARQTRRPILVAHCVRSSSDLRT